MSRQGRVGAPSDEQLLEALDRLVEVDGIVKASERLAVSYRTAANCHESRHVSRKMRGVLHKCLRQQGELAEQEAQVEAAASPQVQDEPGGGEGPRLQESEQDLRDEVAALRAEVVDLRERLDAVEGQAARAQGRGDHHVDVGGMDAGERGSRRRTVAAPRRVFPELVTEEAEPGKERVYGALAEMAVKWREAWKKRKAARRALA